MGLRDRSRLDKLCPIPRARWPRRATLSLGSPHLRVRPHRELAIRWLELLFRLGRRRDMGQVCPLRRSANALQPLLPGPPPSGRTPRDLPCSLRPQGPMPPRHASATTCKPLRRGPKKTRPPPPDASERKRRPRRRDKQGRGTTRARPEKCQIHPRRDWTEALRCLVGSWSRWACVGRTVPNRSWHLALLREIWASRDVRSHGWTLG
mmetsp:Transcript_8778/g.19194  ORF Transcript_8778/g.19194 Transcript_8778/m.19194 type:complete len:207 (+) Transcript_8778:147-767(+)